MNELIFSPQSECTYTNERNENDLMAVCTGSIIHNTHHSKRMYEYYFHCYEI